MRDRCSIWAHPKKNPILEIEQVKGVSMRSSNIRIYDPLLDLEILFFSESSESQQNIINKILIADFDRSILFEIEGIVNESTNSNSFALNVSHFTCTSDNELVIDNKPENHKDFRFIL